MNGVIVVPAVAMKRKMYPELSWKPLQVEAAHAHPHAAVLDLGHRVRGHEDLTPRERGEQAGNGWIFVAADEIVDAAELLPVRVEQVAADDEREMEDAWSRGRCHAADPTPRDLFG